MLHSQIQCPKLLLGTVNTLTGGLAAQTQDFGDVALAKALDSA